MSNFLKRTLTGIAFSAAIVFSLLIDLRLFILLFFLITLAGMLEFYKLSCLIEVRPNFVAGLIAGSVLFLSSGLLALGYLKPNDMLLNLITMTLPIIFEIYRKSKNPIANIAFTYFGIFYIAAPLALLLFFPNSNFLTHDFYPGILLGFFALVWINDSAAYLVGSKFGRTLFFERISPRKTWEGAIAGALVTLAASYFVSLIASEPGFHHWLIIAAIVVVFSTLGDLFESLIKRSLNVKDSGRMLPGHGGILDRFDGILLAAPIVFVYLNFAL